MNTRIFICTEGLPYRTISPNEYQNPLKDRREAQVVRHFERLSVFLCKANGNPNVDDNCLIVNSLTVDHQNGENGTTPKVFDKGTPVQVKDLFGIKGLRNKPMKNDRAVMSEKRIVVKNYDSDTELLNIVENITEKEAVKVTDSSKNSDQIENELQPVILVNNNENYNYVDVEGMAKLKKLCGLLKANVDKLKTIINKKREDQEPNSMDSDQVDLDVGLQSLDNDLTQLIKRLDNMKGSRKAMKKAVDMYRDCEVQYRCLKTLNKKDMKTMKSNIFSRFIKDYLCCLHVKMTHKN